MNMRETLRKYELKLSETSPWLHAGCIGPGVLQYETSRADFIGRGIAWPVIFTPEGAS